VNILITNALPLNGGDEAILRATRLALLERWPQARIAILCRHVLKSRALLPDLDLSPDLESAVEVAPAPLRLLARASGRMPALRRLGVRPAFFERARDRRGIVERYRAADLVISAPGGFLHDFYPIEARLRGFELALKLGKPLVLFAQSLGPFSKPESLRRIPEVLNRAARICVRDAISRQHLLDCGVDENRIVETADAAFLWRRLAPDVFRAKTGAARIVGMCFRAWPLHDLPAAAATVAKAVALCRELLADPARRLVFLSTCQGVAGYIDDSEMAAQVVAELPTEMRARCEVDRVRRRPRELILALGACDAFVGMRLHACLLAMLGGTPAFGLGYEDKTPGIYGQLGLERWQLPFDQDAAVWLGGVRDFLENLPQISAVLPATLDRAADLADRNLDAVASILSNS
jgi:colanic acid/amylovoran biosynthesis protein